MNVIIFDIIQCHKKIYLKKNHQNHFLNIISFFFDIILFYIKNKVYKTSFFIIVTSL